MVVRSVAKADVAELSAALGSAVDQEKAHHLIIVGTNKVLSTTQFKQMFYSRGDDFFQIANVYECPDNCESVHSSVWGIDCKDPHVGGTSSNAVGLVTMDGNRLTGVPGEANPTANSSLANRGVGYSSGTTDIPQDCFNFNKLGGRENDPKGCAWAYSYAHDADRNFYAQHEVMGYLEKDTCVKRDFWTACSRMSIEDQLYGLAFASETDQDLCMAVTCARRWSEVEDALAESCAAANNKIMCPKKILLSGKLGGIQDMAAGTSIIITGTGGVLLWSFTAATAIAVADIEDQINATVAGQTNHVIKFGRPGWTSKCPTAFQGALNADLTRLQLNLAFWVDGCDPTIANIHISGTTSGIEQTGGGDGIQIQGLEVARDKWRPSTVDLYINVRVSNSHPQALDTILRVRFTVSYSYHEPSSLHYWNTRASKAAEGVIKTGVVGDAPEGGKKQHEDTTVVST